MYNRGSLSNRKLKSGASSSCLTLDYQLQMDHTEADSQSRPVSNQARLTVMMLEAVLIDFNHIAI